MIVLQEHFHDLVQVLAGHDRLTQHGVRTHIEPHSQVQAQCWVPGQFKCVAHQLGEIVFADPGANARDAGLGQGSATQQCLAFMTLVFHQVDEDQHVLRGGRGFRHRAIWPHMTI